MQKKEADMKDLDETEVARDFRRLSRQIEDNGLTKRRLSYFLLQLLGIIGLEIFGFLMLFCFGSSWIPYVGAGLCLALSQTQALWLRHDLGHLSMFRSKALNQLAEHLISGHMQGMSASLWTTLHQKHHNTPTANKREPGENMNMSSFAFKFLSLPVWMAWANFKFMIQRHAVVELCVALTFYGKLFFCLSPVLGGALGAFGMFVFVRIIEMHWYTWCGFTGHTTNENSNERVRESAIHHIHQLKSLNALETNAFIDWLTGPHSYEIEHHLFPSLPRHNLNLVAPLVQKFCKHHGLIYNQKHMYSAFWDNIRDITTSPMAWIDTVKDFH